MATVLPLLAASAQLGAPVLLGAPALRGPSALLGATALSPRSRGRLWREVAGSLMATVLPLLGAPELLVAPALLGATELSRWSRGRLRRPRPLVLWLRPSVPLTCASSARRAGSSTPASARCGRPCDLCWLSVLCELNSARISRSLRAELATSSPNVPARGLPGIRGACAAARRWRSRGAARGAALPRQRRRATRAGLVRVEDHPPPALSVVDAKYKSCFI